MRAFAVLCLAALAALSLTPARAQAWDWFRSENSDVREGNAQLEKNQLDKALAAYGAAAKRLPGAGGVHLDRGIALLRSGKAGEAREALRLATQGDASAEVRAKANYNLGLAFMQDADTLAKEENLDEAQKLLRESADAFKSSLRAQPKNRDAAWNLELAKRRLVDLDKKQQEKKEQEKKDENKDKKKDDESDKNDENQDGDQKKDDQQKKDDEEKKDQQGDQDAGPPDQEDAGAPAEPDAGADKKPEPKPDEQQEQSEPKEDPGQAKPDLPEHMQQALDALENSEENLQKHRAAMRARQRPRRIEKDW